MQERLRVPPETAYVRVGGTFYWPDTAGYLGTVPLHHRGPLIAHGCQVVEFPDPEDTLPEAPTVVRTHRPKASAAPADD